MQNTRRTALAEAFDAWTLTYGVSVADVARASRLSRHAVENVRDGGPRRPLQETLRKVAAGIVRKAPPLDRAAAEQACYHALSVAAGYGEPPLAEPDGLLALGLWYSLRDPPRAQAWRVVFEHGRHLTPRRVLALRDAIDAQDDERCC